MNTVLQTPPLRVLGAMRRPVQSRTLAVLPGDHRPIRVRLLLSGGGPGGSGDEADRSPVLEFRPRGSRHPFCVSLQRLWRAHLESGEVRQALQLVHQAARQAEDAGQLWFGGDWQPALPAPATSPEGGPR